VLAGAPEPVEEACADYGQSLGTAFQVIDDVLDYAGDPAEMGKNLGDDLREGKATLPLILAMQRGTPEESSLVRGAIEQGDTEHLSQIGQIVQRTGALDGTRALAAQQAERAIAAAAQLPQNNYAASLIELAAQLLQRRS